MPEASETSLFWFIVPPQPLMWLQRWHWTLLSEVIWCPALGRWQHIPLPVTMTFKESFLFFPQPFEAVGQNWAGLGHPYFSFLHLSRSIRTAHTTHSKCEICADRLVNQQPQALRASAWIQQLFFLFNATITVQAEWWLQVGDLSQTYRKGLLLEPWQSQQPVFW